MHKKHKVSIALLRRELRLEDNLTLYSALEHSDFVAPCFIFDPRQTEPHTYRSLPGLQFMIESLEELSAKIKKQNGKFFVFSGKQEEVLEQIMKDEIVEAVYLSRDYTPFSRERDSRIETAVKNYKKDVYFTDNHFLNTPDSVKSKSGTPYTIFTPYWKEASGREVLAPKSHSKFSWYTDRLPGEESLTEITSKILPTRSSTQFTKGGRSSALGLLENVAQLKDYKELRNLPAVRGTSGLSAHLKFGTISPREVHAHVNELFGPSHDLIRQLYWRDFFTQIGFHFPAIYGNSFQKKYSNVPWDNDLEAFELWCRGETGFPIVDAGMRELNTTGYMHNRVRMIVASFLTKDLHIDWRWGEKYFAEKLIDYDPAVNNGSWQWAASTGCDAQPYFRIFNPWLQQAKFDPEALYIKKWLPELAGIAAKAIHNFSDNPPAGLSYPAPLLDHKAEARDAEKRFKEAK